jgi:xanthine dehydrogenase large subunit
MRGESIYLDDIAILQGTLFAACFDSWIAHGIITKLDTTGAEKVTGVVRVSKVKDMKGESNMWYH